NVRAGMAGKGGARIGAAEVGPGLRHTELERCEGVREDLGVARVVGPVAAPAVEAERHSVADVLGEQPQPVLEPPGVEEFRLLVQKLEDLRVARIARAYRTARALPLLCVARHQTFASPMGSRVTPAA